MKGILITILIGGACFFFSDSQKGSKETGSNFKIPNRLIIKNCCRENEFRDTCIELMETVQQGLLDYENYGTLLDSSGTNVNSVNSRSIQRFYSLFLYGKKQPVLNDLNWMKRVNGTLQPTKIEEITAEKYAELVFFVHKENGFKFKLTQPICTNIRYDEYHESYLITVFVRKDFFSRIDEKGKSVSMSGGNIAIKILFDIPKYDFKRIKIRKLYN